MHPAKHTYSMFHSPLIPDLTAAFDVAPPTHAENCTPALKLCSFGLDIKQTNKIFSYTYQVIPAVLQCHCSTIGKDYPAGLKLQKFEVLAATKKVGPTCSETTSRLSKRIVQSSPEGGPSDPMSGQDPVTDKSNVNERNRVQIKDQHVDQSSAQLQ